MNSENSQFSERKQEEDMSLEAMVREYEIDAEEVRLGADGEIEYIPKNSGKAKRGIDFDIEYGMMNTTWQERGLAALAHIVPWLMVGWGTMTYGFPVSLFLLLGTALLYLGFRDRSDFVSTNAREALKAQLIGIFGWTVIPVILSLIAVIVIIPLAISIVGILLIPFVVLALVLGILASVLLPFALLIFSAIGAVRALGGEVYRYPIPRINRRLVSRVGARFRNAPHMPWNR